MKVELEITMTELALLYISTGNEDAGRIVREAARKEAERNPQPSKRKRLSSPVLACVSERNL
jgi:hypothetical protein